MVKWLKERGGEIYWKLIHLNSFKHLNMFRAGSGTILFELLNKTFLLIKL